ncbi:FCD domain-containing protein [Nocardioides sp. BP30]|uniref:FadR/GntR family transcriptional regulator n=1 Tax=Nocardioides sp. BP30 TaxID=3036374 RepID=UPI002468816B|nr:FCD domain-containing protein [Nocardioides sp. BP30]WGL50854.1 FCD domain-containing protein [Nocardioides sp. BP30]
MSSTPDAVPSQPPSLPASLLRPVHGHHAFEACVEQLATAIRLGVYPLGSTLPPERDLAALLHVSRATLREAMAALRQAGLVATTRGRGGGTVVTLKPPTPSARAAARTTAAQRADWLDALTYRRIIECGAVTMLACSELSEEARERLLAAHHEVRAATRPAQYRQSDSRFHLTLAALTGSDRLIDAVTSVHATLHEMLLAIPQLPTNIAHSDAQHEAVVQAILDGRPDAARRAMEHHCDDTAALLRGLLT